MTNPYRLRLAHILATRGPTVVVGLLAFGVLTAGVAGVTYLQQEPTTRTVTERTHVQTSTLTVNDSAVVTTNGTLWPRGTRLHEQPVYLRRSMPNLTLTTKTAVPPGKEVTVHQQLTLLIHVRVEGRTIRTKQIPLAADERTVTNGRMVTRTTIHIAALETQFSRIRERVSAPVTLTTRLRVRTRYDTGRYAGTLTTAAPLSIRTATYSVGAFDPASRTHAQQVTRHVVQPQPLREQTVIGGVLSLVSLVGAAIASAMHRRIDDPADLRHRLERAKLDEWISTGQVPEDAGERTVSVTSLTDLVDVAIDANARVIHDEWRGVYVVIHHETVYEYRDPLTTWETVDDPE